MAGAKPFQCGNDASENAAPERSSSQPDELESLREETRRLRQLVVQLSRIAIKNAVNMK